MRLICSVGEKNVSVLQLLTSEEKMVNTKLKVT